MDRFNLRSLMQPGARGDAITLFGVRPGDAAEGLRRAPLTGADDRRHEGRVYRGEKIYRRLDNGTEQEVPLQELITSALESGGWLRVGPIAFSIDGGSIARIFVRGPDLEALGIQRIEQIPERFGPPEGIERDLGWVLHHYPSRALVVAWHTSEARLEHIALGPDPWKSPRFGAMDLLQELVSHWQSFEDAKWRVPEGGSIRARYQRVAALAKALELGSVEDVVQGAFIKRDPARYRALLGAIAARGPLADRSERDRRMPDATLADWVYRHLLAYRVDAERVLSATSGWLECSDPALLGMIATQNAISSELRTSLGPIHEWLCSFFGGSDLTFDERDLIEKFGWPEVDIRAMEIDEF